MMINHLPYRELDNKKIAERIQTGKSVTGVMVLREVKTSEMLGLNLFKLS
jgi:hypothetical protein